MALPDAAAAYYQAKVDIGLSTVGLARNVWSRLGVGDFDQAWRSLGPQLTVVVSAGQLASVNQAVAYVPAVLGELGVDSTAVADVAAGSLVGVASDGRDLASLLYQPVVETRAALGQGASLPDALDSGRHLLDLIVATQTADAGRAAETIASYVRPAVQLFVRACASTACPRCAVLAGKFTRMETAFLRHPSCHCFNIPVDGRGYSEMVRSTRQMIEDGDVTGLSAADTKAILDGADPAKVINAHRGMSTEQVFGQRLKVTTEGTSKRAGNFTVTTKIDGKSVKVRLRPQAIYQIAGNDRAEAIRLLRLYGYVL